MCFAHKGRTLCVDITQLLKKLETVTWIDSGRNRTDGPGVAQLAGKPCIGFLRTECNMCTCNRNHPLCAEPITDSHLNAHRHCLTLAEPSVEHLLLI